MHATRYAYRPVLTLALKLRWLVVIAALLFAGFCGHLALSLGSEFVPNLDEGDIAMHALRIPGTSLGQALRLQEQLELQIKKQPEVERVFAKIGTAEVATDAVPPSVADNFIILKPREQWADPNKTKSQVVEELESLVTSIPGNRYEFLQPIQMRFNELISGVRAELAVKVFGDDFDQLIALGDQIESTIETVRGSADVAVEQATGLSLMTIKPDRPALARYGISIKDLQDLIASALGGREVGQFYEGDRRADIVVRLPEALRTNPDWLSNLPVPVPSGGYIPLGEVASPNLTTGFNQIYRENGKRRVVVSANVRGRDLGSFVNDVKRAVRANVDIPPGYWLEYGGTFQQLESATRRLAIVVPVTLFLIVGLLVMALGSLRDAAVIFSGVPLAVTGGIIALVMRDIPFSISAAVGFIAPSGIAVLNGLIMVAFIRDLRMAGRSVDEALIEGALVRYLKERSGSLLMSLR